MNPLDLVAHDEVFFSWEMNWMLVDGIWTESDVTKSTWESFRWVNTSLLKYSQNTLHFEFVFSELQEVHKVLLRDAEHRLIVWNHDRQCLFANRCHAPVWRNGRYDSASFVRQFGEHAMGGVKNTIRRRRAGSSMGRRSTSCRRQTR